MKNLKFLICALVICLLISSCQNRYSDTFYAASPFDNLRIAVLPYEVTTTGRVTEQMSSEDIEAIETVERLAFQSSLYHQMVDRLGRSRQSFNVQVQHFSETNRLIKQGGHQMDELSQLSATELSALLEVDAVIRSNVHKQIFFTDFEAYGLNLARHLIFIFGDGWPWYIPNKSGEVRLSSSIVSSENGTTLWAGSRKCNSNWDRDTYDTIERINYQMTKRMPL